MGAWPGRPGTSGYDQENRDPDLSGKHRQAVVNVQCRLSLNVSFAYIGDARRSSIHYLSVAREDQIIKAAAFVGWRFWPTALSAHRRNGAHAGEIISGTGPLLR